MTSGPLPRYLRHKGKNKGYVRVSRDDKPIYFPGEFQSIESVTAYQQWCSQYQLQHDLVTQINKNETTINDVIVCAMTWATEYYGGTDTLYYWKTAGRLLQPLGDQLARSFGPKKFKAIRQQLITETENGYKTIRRKMDALRNFFQVAYEEEILEADIYLGLKEIKNLRAKQLPAHRRPKTRRSADPIAVDMLVDALPDSLACMVRLQQLTGMRSSELVQLNWGDIDTNGETWLFCPERHKTQYLGESREVYLGPKCQKLLEAYQLTRYWPDAPVIFTTVERMVEEHLTDAIEPTKRGSTGQILTALKAGPPTSGPRKQITSSYRTRVKELKDSGYKLTYTPQGRTNLWAYEGWENPNKNDTRSPAELIDYYQAWRGGDRYTSHLYGRQIARYQDRYNLPRFTSHQLRHLHASTVQDAFDLEHASAALGHSSLHTTKVYAKRSNAKADAVAKLLS